MGQVTGTDGVAILILAFYAVAVIASAVVAFRHGLSRNSGWIFLCIFSVIRIIYAAATLSTINNPTQTAATIAEITAFLGLSPLLLASLGLISRLYYGILKSPWNLIFSFGALKVVQTPTAIALILCIVGATSADTPADITSQGTVQAGVVLFLVVLIILMLLVLGGYVGRRKTGRGEEALLYALAISLPFLLVRIIYSLLSCFAHVSAFTPGSEQTDAIVAQFFMATLMEMIVTGVYLWAGLTLKRAAPGEGGSKFTERLGRGDFGGGKLGLVTLAGAAVTAVREEMSQGHGHDRQQGEGEIRPVGEV